MIKHYQPLHHSGELLDMVDRVTIYVETHASGISHFRDHSIDVPVEALQMIENYVGEPPSVSRMSSLGSSVERWLEVSNQTQGEISC